MEIQTILSQMSLKDKIRLCSGADFWHTKAMPKYGIPSFSMADGPHGLRWQNGKTDMLGINNSLPATCFPPAVTAGATWDEELLALQGQAIGEEALAYGVDMVLGPGCNIKRDPLCGRNFEYFSEDPFLSGKLAAAFINGQQSTGVSSCLKHFAANNQEYKRQSGDSRVDERALWEIYLAPFELAVKEGRPGAVMASYNKLNGVYASDNPWLLTQVLRKEWGFEGLVVSDWGGLADRIKAFQAGCDLGMPGGSGYMEKAALRAVRNGTLSELDIDTSAGRVLSMTTRCAQLPKGGGSFDRSAHHALARRVAERGAVLLKNEDSLLPVKVEDMVLIGTMAKDFRYQGAGSSHINPTRQVSLTEALPSVPFVPCCDREGNTTPEGLAEAVHAARRAKVAVVVAGLPTSYEAEGFDRETMSIPAGHREMIEAVAGANPNTAVVLLGGGAMETPWRDKVRSILYLGLPGQAGGEACANLLTGTAVPCGKLTESWPVSYGDTVTRETFGQKNPEYRESIYVGYRYYDKAHKPVAFPFGHGLSYTSFSYSDLQITPDTVSVTVTNTGSRKGAEVVQFYVSPPKGGLHRPEKELKGFARVELSPGENKTVTFPLSRRSFALWDGDWKVPGGVYQILVGASSRDIRLSGTLELAGASVSAPDWQGGSWYETLEGLPSRRDWETMLGHHLPPDPPLERGSFTLDNSCLEMKDFSRVMALQYWLTEHIISLGFRRKRDYTDPTFRMMMICATDCPLWAMVTSSGGILREWAVRGLLALANGRPSRR